jgi:hypothetical protein
LPADFKVNAFAGLDVVASYKLCIATTFAQAAIVPKAWIRIEASVGATLLEAVRGGILVGE